MKTLTPVKAVALAALAAGLALPAAHATPTAPLKPVPMPKRAYTLSPTQTQMVLLAQARLVRQMSAHTKATQSLIDFATQGDVTNGVAMLFQGSHRSYVIEPDVSGTVNVKLNGVSFDQALDALASANSLPLEWSFQGGVYHIRPWITPPNAVITLPGSGQTVIVPNPSVTLDLKKVPIRQALDTLFAAARANCTVAAGISDDDTVTVHLTNVPLVQALDAVLAASEVPLTYTVKRGGIFVITPERTRIPLFGGPSRTLFTINRNDQGIEQEFAELLVERAAKLSGGATPHHPDVVSLDARIADLQRRLGAKASGTMKRKAVNPAPGKAP